MFAVYAAGIDPADPLSVLGVGEVPDPVPPAGWVRVRVRAASLNHHDLWALRGQALHADRVPMVLGTDAAGVTEDGREVIVHAVLGDPRAGRGDETLDPGRTLLSESHPGTLAQWVAVPGRNLVPKPAELSFEHAACLPTAYLTAYRMLKLAGTDPGDTILVQGAGGGVATALVLLGSAMGLRVWVTSRDPARGAAALALGAAADFPAGARLPERVDAVMETVGAATWAHSLKALRPGGRVVVSGATSGPNPPADLNRIYFRSLSVIGTTMGTVGELGELVALISGTGVRPLVDSVRPMTAAAAAMAQLASGQVWGKLVLVP